MKILLIHNYYQYYGGEDTYFDSLKELLMKNGHEVKIFTKKSKDIKTFFHKLNAILSIFWNFRVGEELDTIIKEFKPDVAQFQNIYPLIGPIAYWVCKKNNIPTVQRVSNYRLLCPKGTLFRNNKICELCVNRKFKSPAVKYNCYHASKVASLFFIFAQYIHTRFRTADLVNRYLFPSEFTKKYIVKNASIPLHKTAVIPSFSQTSIKGAPTKKEEYFLYVGRLSEEKGILQLFNLFSTLPQFQLIIIGDGPLKNTLMNMHRYKNISVKGFLSKKEIHSSMRKALFTIIPSLCYDVFPNTLIESYSCGTPVIVPRLGSFIDLVKEGKTGIFYKNGDFDSLQNKLLKINKGRRKEMGRFAREEYQHKYSPKIYLKNIVDEYQMLKQL